MKGRCNAFRCAIHVAQPHYGADCCNHWLSNCEVMTLRELIYSVDSEQYSESLLYQKPKVQLLDAILHELSSIGFSDSEASDFWSDFDNLQKAKIIR